VLDASSHHFKRLVANADDIMCPDRNFSLRSVNGLAARWISDSNQAGSVMETD
jgi:hypothetical protein